jgi:hypothetical protein
MYPTPEGRWMRAVPNTAPSRMIFGLPYETTVTHWNSAYDSAAPVIYLHSQDPYLPSDFQTHLSHSTPKVNFEAVEGPESLDLNNLDQLGREVWLTSNDDVTQIPDWIRGNRPDENGKTEGTTAAVVVADKGDGVVDAFYFYFFTYNWGGLVAKILGFSNLNFGKRNNQCNSSIVY